MRGRKFAVTPIAFLATPSPTPGALVSPRDATIAVEVPIVPAAAPMAFLIGAAPLISLAVAARALSCTRAPGRFFNPTPGKLRLPFGANELRGIEARHDVAALGTATERSQWARVQRVEAGLVGLPDSPDAADARARFALVKGTLYFQLDEAFGARLWQEHRSLKDVSLALHETQSRWIRVERARHNVPQNNGEFAERVASLRQRIASLQERLAATEERQSAYLAQIAVQELEQQKARLAAYEVQARFALATMYDRAATEGTNRGKAPTPVQRGNGATEELPAESSGEPVEDTTAPPAGGTPPPEPPR